jgi:hypothetical protein
MRGIRLWTALALGGATAVLTIGGPASAQVDLRILRQQNEIRQQQEIARQNALAAQRQSLADQNRYATQLTLRGLESSANPPAGPTLRSSQPIPPRGPEAADAQAAGITAEMAADAARMDRLTDQRLAEGNARLRAITPAQ